MRLTSIFISLLLALPLSVAWGETNPDPWEGFNRKMFSFNEAMDSYILRPTAVGYRKVTNEPIRSTVSNVFNNLKEVRTIINDLAQLKLRQAGADTSRFVINSTLGFFGFFDVASPLGLTRHNEDFGQTLGYWGVGSGPYLMLPFLGPSTVRDASGLGIEYSSGISYSKYFRNDLEGWAAVTFGGINMRSELLDMESMLTGDKYTFIRSFYLQQRQYLINDGQIQDDFDDDFDDWDDDFDEFDDE